MRANTLADVTAPNDIAISADGAVVDSIVRYHDAMSRITARRDIRNDVSRYEAVGLALVAPSGDTQGEVLGLFPELASPLRFERFFESLYSVYDLRFVYAARKLEQYTRRLGWSDDSPALADAVAAGFVPRIGGV
jgi:hypothetical protein